MCLLCDVCDVYGGDEATLSREVCVSQVHTVCSWQGVEGRLLTLFYYYILTFLIFFLFFFFTRLHRDPMAGKLGLPSIFGAHQNDL